MRLLLVAATLVLAGTVGLATPAMASDRDNICEYREMCLYYFTNYQGYVKTFADTSHIPNLNSFFFATNINVNDNSMSGKNRSDRRGARLYVNSWMRGANLYVGKNENIPNFSPWNNQFSSLWWNYV
jgi:hypothetical protein